ncbi:alpha/beta hydrolase [Galbibacter pacificus]|uniref:Alpha/beta hydrolase n=1 Tax=Galbibacter pacificus TaxID=2996052 RepID=A0ABT6FV33_9FLAO|nr:alpha/beta hydrolase [Galbibacter pacificus]MDG3583394.1 alpha/beta hydrolase [Galbibacter pacificus]MDG3587129.1 alpha/beta hydrolase [Galbibacter pacificus]
MTNQLSRIITIIVICLTSSFVSAQNKSIPLYQGKIPNSTGAPEEEIRENNNILLISNVQKPALEVFTPPKRNRNGKAVIICPGGGYHYLAYDWEGTEIAKWFNSKGITAFVLKYRLPIAKTVTNKSEVPLSDAIQAIKMVRKNAETWNINPNDIGIMGFSAGGHLASTLGTHYNMDYNIKNDPYKDISARPDFMILIYPVITMEATYTHRGSREALLGKQPTDEIIDLYSNEKQITKNTPPTFLLHCEDDDVVPVENSLLFYKALKENNVPAEMHLYPKGGHGFGLASNNAHLQTWTQRLYEWLWKMSNN